MKWQKIVHFIHKRLGEVVATSRQEREERLGYSNETENGAKRHAGSSDRVTNISRINAEILLFVLG